MKKFMVADLVKNLDQEKADEWNITVSELQCIREISQNESDWRDILNTAESLGVGPCDIDEGDVENFVDMGRENKGSLESSIGTIQWVYDNTLKAYLILAYLTFELDKPPKPVMYKLSPDMMKEWNNSDSFGEYWNQNIRKNAQIEDDEWACGCNPNPCEPQKIDQFTNKFNSIS